MNLFQKTKNGAALLLTLLIISVAGGTVLVLGRDILATTSTTNRYTDSLVAEQAAWAGVEDGLSKVRTSFPSGDGVDWTANIPDFMSNSGDTNFPMVIRRNVSTDDLPNNNQISGDKDNDNIFEGINYENPSFSSVADSCTGLPRCNPADWDSSDVYYDLRVSGADYVKGINDLDAVNLKTDDTLINETGYYQISQAEQAEYQKIDPQIDYVDRIFDLTNYAGTTGTNQYQRIVLWFKYLTNIPANSLNINFYVKYNVNMDSCYAPPTCPSSDKNLCPGKDGRSFGNFYVSTNTIPAGNQGDPNKYVYAYIPYSCTAGGGTTIADNVEYLGARFRFTGCSGCKIAFGLRESSNPPPLNNSYIGTGLIKVLSTGIYGNVRKTIEVWAQKMIYNPNIGGTGELKCLNGKTNPNNCEIRVYKVTK